MNSRLVTLNVCYCQMDLIGESLEARQPSSQEALLEFLQKTKVEHLLSEITSIFSVDFPIREIIISEGVVLDVHIQEYENLTLVGSFMDNNVRYVHVGDINVADSSKCKVQRDLEKVPVNAKKIQCKCPVHGSSCSVVSYYEGFIIYLHLALEDEEEDKADEEPPSLLPLEDDVEDVEEELDDLAERNLAENFDSEAAQRDSVIPVSMSPADEDELGDLPVPILPTF